MVMLSARLPKSASEDVGQAVLMLFIRTKSKHALSSLHFALHACLPFAALRLRFFQ